jgi:hypothetical protein
MVVDQIESKGHTMWITSNALDTIARDADAYLNPETFECMRRVVVWTNPSTGREARRYRAMDHQYSPLGGHCVHCGFGLDD